MSVKVMNWVFSGSRSRKSGRLLMLALADRANDEGTDAWPSEKTLAAKVGVDERTVRRQLRALQRLGELRYEQRPGLTNYYTIIMQPCLPLASAPTPRHADCGAQNPSETPDNMSGVPADDPGHIVRGDNLSARSECPPTPDTTVRPPRTLLSAKTSGTSSTSKTETPRAREAQPNSAEPAPGARLIGSHRSHASCVAPCCVPGDLHREFVRKSGISDETAADAFVRAWYADVSAIWAGRAVANDDFGFWRARWKERVTDAPANRWTPAAHPERSGTWGEIFQRLKMDLGSHVATQWFGAVTVISDAGNILTLALPSTEHRDFVTRRYGEALRVAADIVRLGLTVDLFVPEPAEATA